MPPASFDGVVFGSRRMNAAPIRLQESLDAVSGLLDVVQNEDDRLASALLFRGDTPLERLNLVRSAT